jgi:hypothetical protein
MPVSERKAEANRKNAQKSTGPRTEAGKERTRANALKHGLSGEGIVVTPAESLAIAERMEQWRPEYRIDSPRKEWAFEELVASAVRIERCKEEIHRIQESDKRRAANFWDIDRRDDAAVLGEKLRRRPEVVARTLMKSKHGCEWLLEQWDGLGAALESGKTWTDEQAHRALDLCGVPRNGREKSPKPREPLAGVNIKCSQLQDLINNRYEHIDELDRLDAMDGFPSVPNRRIAQIRRYEAACLKRMVAAENFLIGKGPEPEEMPEKPPEVVEPPPTEEELRASLSEAELAEFEAWKVAFDAKFNAEMPLPVPAPIKLSTAVPTPAAKPVPHMNRKQRRALAKRAAQAK